MNKRRRDPGKVIRVDFRRPKKSSIPSQDEYERRERSMFTDQLRSVEKAPLAERKSNASRFAEVLFNDPELVAERVGWVLNGSYGRGSYTAAHDVIRRTRMNAGAWLTTTAAALEWRTSHKMAVDAWKKLSSRQQEHLRHLIDREIRDALSSE